MHRSFVVLVASLALLSSLASAPASSRAAVVSSAPCAMPDVSDSSSPDSRLGVLAAIGCGIFVRATVVTAFTQMGTIVGAVACCGYMIFDACTENHR